MKLWDITLAAFVIAILMGCLAAWQTADSECGGRGGVLVRTAAGGYACVKGTP